MTMKTGDYIKAIPNEKWLFSKEEVVSNSQMGILLSIDRDKRSRSGCANPDYYYKIQLGDDYGVFHSSDYYFEVLSAVK